MITPELGKVVPAVDPADLKALWGLSRTKTPDGRTAAIGMSVVKSVCSPDANVDAISWRASMLGLAIMQDKMSEGMSFNEDDISENVIGLFATFPFRFVEVSKEEGFKLNGEEFTTEFEKLSR